MMILNGNFIHILSFIIIFVFILFSSKFISFNKLISNFYVIYYNFIYINFNIYNLVEIINNNIFKLLSYFFFSILKINFFKSVYNNVKFLYINILFFINFHFLKINYSSLIALKKKPYKNYTNYKEFDLGGKIYNLPEFDPKNHTYIGIEDLPWSYYHSEDLPYLNKNRYTWKEPAFWRWNKVINKFTLYDKNGVWIEYVSHDTWDLTKVYKWQSYWIKPGLVPNWFKKFHKIENVVYIMDYPLEIRLNLIYYLLISFHRTIDIHDESEIKYTVSEKFSLIDLSEHFMKTYHSDEFINSFHDRYYLFLNSNNVKFLDMIKLFIYKGGDLDNIRTATYLKTKFDVTVSEEEFKEAPLFEKHGFSNDISTDIYLNSWYFNF